MSTFTQQPDQTIGISSWVTAEGQLPPGVITSHSGAPPASLLSGTAEPPTSVAAQLTGIPTNGPPAGFTGIPSGATGPPSGIHLPSGLTGPPPGFTPPSGVTGPPAGFSIPTGVAGPPAGFSIPSGVTGMPAGFTGVPTGVPGGLAGAGSGGLPPVAISHALTNDQSHALIAVTSMLLVLCLAAVGGRLVARRISRMRIEADDWICVAALVIFIGLCIEQFWIAYYGIHIGSSNGPPDMATLQIFGKAEFSSQITYAFVTCAAKASLLMLYRRVFFLRARWFRIAWWTNVGLVGAFFVALVILNCTQCKPISTVWTSPGSCIPDQAKSSSTGFINAVIDMAILVLPLRTVWSLQMSHKQKMAVCGVFGLGLIGVAVSLARAISISSPSLFKGGGLSFILWSTTEPAVALICSCLPVLRPLYTTGMAKLGSSRGPWNWYASKRSKSYGDLGGSAGKDKEKSYLGGSTLRSDETAKNKEGLSWLKTTDSEAAGGYQQMQSPISPLDKPLPPAYSPPYQEDTGYHTWTWNLLSRPRNENHSPNLTRSPKVRDSATPWQPPTWSDSGVHTSVSAGRRIKRKNSPPRLKTHTPILDTRPQPQSQFSDWNSPPRTAKSHLIKWARPSPMQSPRSDCDSWASPSLIPTRHISKRDIHPANRISSIDSNSPILPSKPRPVARVETESTERLTPPKLNIRTANNSPAPPTPLRKPSPPTNEGRNSRRRANSHIADWAESHAMGSPRGRSNSDETLWPSVAPTDVGLGLEPKGYTAGGKAMYWLPIRR